MKLAIALMAMLFVIQLSGCTNSSQRVRPAPVYDHGARVGGGASTTALEMPEVTTEGEDTLADPGEQYRITEVDSAVPQAPTSAPPAAEPGTAVPAAGGEQVAYAGPSAASASMSKAAASLLEKAEWQQTAGDLTGAASTLERAVRIEARNPVLWNRLANVRLQQGYHDLAIEFASKSSEFAGADEGLRQNNAQIISMAKSSSGSY